MSATDEESATAVTCNSAKMLFDGTAAAVGCARNGSLSRTISFVPSARPEARPPSR